MATTYSQLIEDGSVQLDLIYEESPVFAGGEENALSAVLKFKYIGDVPESPVVESQGQNGHRGRGDDHTRNGSRSENGGSTVEGREPEPKAKAEVEGEGGWFSSIGKRVSMQLSNTTRNMLLQELETLEEEDEKDKYKEKTFIAGYTQIFGYYIYNNQIFDSVKFAELAKKTVIGGKLAGITGLEYEDKSGDGFFTNFASGFGNIFHSSLIPDDISDEDDSGAGPAGTNHHDTTKRAADIVPFFSSDQSILFPEINIKPQSHENLVNSFYISIKLPKFLPPTFASLTSLRIQYNFIVGYQVLDKDGKWQNKSLFFPLEVRPYVNKFGQQPLFDLLTPAIGYKTRTKILELPHEQYDNDDDDEGQGPNFKDIKRRLMFKERRRSTMVASTFNNEIGHADSIEREEMIDDRKKFFQFINDMNEKKVHQLIGIQEKFENEFLNLSEGNARRKVENVKENLINVFNSPESIAARIKAHNENPNLAADDDAMNDTEVKEYHSQIPSKQQLNFILKRNGELITKISLSKSVVTFNEILKIHLSFKNSEVPITGIVTRLLKVERFSNDAYLKSEDEMMSDVELSSNYEFETRLNEVLVSCFNVNDEMSYDMLIPNDLIRTGQFKSNLIETRYSLLFKFILLDKENNDDKKKAMKKKGDGNTEEGEDESLEPKTDTETTEKDNFEFSEIYTDSKGSLYRGVDFLTGGMEFYCKIPIIVLSSYEQDFETTAAGFSKKKTKN